MESSYWNALDVSLSQRSYVHKDILLPRKSHCINLYQTMDEAYLLLYRCTVSPTVQRYLARRMDHVESFCVSVSDVPPSGCFPLGCANACCTTSVRISAKDMLMNTRKRDNHQVLSVSKSIPVVFDSRFTSRVVRQVVIATRRVHVRGRTSADREVKVKQGSTAGRTVRRPATSPSLFDSLCSLVST